MINIVQAQALNYILTKKSFSLVTYNNLDETYFPTFIEEYRYIKTHLDKYGNVPDKETFIQRFPDFELIEVNESEQYLLNQLKEDYLYRSLVPDINKIVDLMSNNKTDKALSYLIQASHKVNQHTSIEPVDLISQCQMRYDTYKEKCENVSQAYSATGLPELDEIIGGWDRNEEYKEYENITIRNCYLYADRDEPIAIASRNAGVKNIVIENNIIDSQASWGCSTIVWDDVDTGDNSYRFNNKPSINLYRLKAQS